MTDAEQQVVEAPQPDVSHIPLNLREYAGKGRRPGQTNVATREAKRVAAMLADQESENFTTWLHQVAATKPERACELYLDLLRIILPQRSGTMSAEFVAADGQSAFGMRFRGMLGTPPVEAQPP